jgi:hypothetical protein
MYFNAWGWSARPKHVAYIDETNKTFLWLTAVRMSVLVLTWIRKMFVSATWTTYSNYYQIEEDMLDGKAYIIWIDAEWGSVCTMH